MMGDVLLVSGQSRVDAERLSRRVATVYEAIVGAKTMEE
jgi:hypothetical protein